ncbi:hypothetical protein A2272_01610 [Candidatus Peregrinibacteria bacterium RIFOXYA12_FULL_33_12]|nr:MAG: hypothetical protein A2263_05120 [Candidatus Peregrinibacteria bacterium RIFOXYA2_FULL_33_21]OGJ46348.1 MAG: hypothetical protein A2272_01610 [Candidatus Peregrinibacteria bacterium RIFOXYA12_FULL_33_12]OGJ50916.1 MAG: hypothetical protein A2307_01575 [Candidatus Peregrinibacteria bacterium RIFOXYB2_FULL_33_20]
MDLDDYLDDFFGVSESQLADQYLNNDQEELFWEWFWYDVPFLMNKTIVETYIIEHEENLNPEETEYLIGLQKSYRSCFRVLEVKKNNGLLIEDMFTIEKFMITEIKGSRYFMSGDVLFARIVPLKTRNVLPASITILKNVDFQKIQHSVEVELRLLGPNMDKKVFLKRNGGILYQQLFE